MAFGQQQRVVTRVEWRSAAIGARIVSHDGGRDGVRGHRVGPCNEHARLHEAKGLAANPRTLAAGNGFNSIDDGEIDRARGNKIRHDVRDAVASVMIDAERQRLDVARFLKHITAKIGDREAALSSICVAELAHGIYRANTPNADRTAAPSWTI